MDDEIERAVTEVLGIMLNGISGDLTHKAMVMTRAPQRVESIIKRVVDETRKGNQCCKCASTNGQEERTLTEERKPAG